MPNIEEMTQEDVDKMQSALDDFKKENKKFREQRDEFKTQLDAKDGEEKDYTKFKERAIKAEAKLAFAGLGVKDADRFIKYLDFEKVSLDDEDNLVGLDDEVGRIKGDFPELFDAKRRVGGRVDAAANNPAHVEKSVTEMQVDRLLGRR